MPLNWLFFKKITRLLFIYLIHKRSIYIYSCSERFANTAINLFTVYKAVKFKAVKSKKILII